MSKKTKTTKPAPAKETTANDKARADALAQLNAKAPAKDATKRGTKPFTKSATTPAANAIAKPAAKRLSALDAAAQVLQALAAKDARTGLSSQELIDRMAAAGLWISPGGQTPAATLYAAMIREISSKGAASRFVRLESTDGARGRFATSAAPRNATTSSPAQSKPRSAKPTPAKAVSQKGGA